MRYEQKLLMNMILAGCCCAGLESRADDWATGIAITNEAAFFDAIDLTRSELTAVREAVAKADWKAAKSAWGKYLEEFIAPRWTWSHRDLEQIAAYLKERGAWDVQADAADKLLTVEGRSLNGNHEDFSVLSRAWMVTRDPKYAEAYARLMREWLAAYPVSSQDGEGAWHRLLQYQRIEAWFEAMNQLMGAPAFDSELRYEISRALVEHARWLHRNPRNKKFMPNNIQGKMLFGLSYVTIMLPEAKESGDWWKLVLLRLGGDHMQKGVYPDGAHVELTPGYHSTQARLYLDIIMLAKKNGVEAPQLFERHEKMFEFNMHVGLPGGSVWPISDCGAGIGGQDHGGSSFLAMGALSYDREDLRYLGTDEVPTDLIWKFGFDKVQGYARMTPKKPAFLSHMMPYAQYAVMRTGWEKQDRQLLFDCAPSGGPHTHCDQLQVLLYSAGRVLLLDPGTCGYQAEDRPYYISHEAHNILLINGKGIARHAGPEVVSWSVKPGAEFAAAKAKNNECVQQRSVLFVKPDYWMVFDHVSGKTEVPTLTRRFHLPPGNVMHEGSTVRTTFAAGDNLWLHAADGAAVSMREGLISADADGNKDVKGPVAAFEGKASLPAALCTLLVPFSDDKQIPTVERLESGDKETVMSRVAFQDARTDWIAVAPSERELAAGKRTGKGMALCVRTDKDGKETAFELFGVTPLQKDGGK